MSDQEINNRQNVKTSNNTEPFSIPEIPQTVNPVVVSAKQSSLPLWFLLLFVITVIVFIGMTYLLVMSLFPAKKDVRIHTPPQIPSVTLVPSPTVFIYVSPTIASPSAGLVIDEIENKEASVDAKIKDGKMISPSPGEGF